MQQHADTVSTLTRPYDHVVVPLDGSMRDQQALRTAQVLADRFGAELEVVMVDDGDPAAAIADRRRELSPAVVVMATRARGRVRGALRGSVARAVVRSAVEPIVVLGPVADNPTVMPRPRSWPGPLSVPRLVAAVDGSPASERVLPVAADWARRLGMSLTILTAVEDVPFGTVRFGPQGDAAAYVASLAARWRDDDLAVDGHVQRDPIGAASGLRAHLAEHPAGLVAVATHAREGLERLRRGAGAASIVHASVAPVLVVPVA